MHPLHTVMLYSLLVFCSALFLFPLVWMLSTSLKELTQAVKMPPEWWPRPFVWENYAKSTQVIDFWRYAANTLFLAMANVVGVVISCSLAAYSFAHIKWHGRDKIFALSLATMMIPFPVLM